MKCPIHNINNAYPSHQVPNNHDTALQQFKAKTSVSYLQNNLIQSIFGNHHLSSITMVYLESPLNIPISCWRA